MNEGLHGALGLYHVGRGVRKCHLNWTLKDEQESWGTWCQGGNPRLRNHPEQNHGEMLRTGLEEAERSGWSQIVKGLDSNWEHPSSPQGESGLEGEVRRGPGQLDGTGRCQSELEFQPIFSTKRYPPGQQEDPGFEGISLTLHISLKDSRGTDVQLRNGARTWGKDPFLLHLCDQR